MADQRYHNAFLRVARFLATALIALSAAPALAAPCGNDSSGFGAWLAAFKDEAAANGVSRSVVERALRDVRYDPRVIGRDRGQGHVFKKSFEDFSARLVTPKRVSHGKALMRRHAALLAKIERQYGVPGAIIVAIWGLETGYGADTGRFPILSAVATLAYDCRRAETFRAELLDALRIVERGDMRPEDMRGDWAGEIGQTQLLPSSYLLYAVDFNGDGTRDLIRDTADALASTANFLQSKGWKRGEGFREGEANFAVLLEWNKARVYAKTIARLAQAIEGETD
ncbi:lytic murein transglycosylase [Methylocystis bryophila]|uniref:Lytic transglycosylase n=1 Tax=Methylocystis bryophila TaxID=655015 RepID=A0A1W6MXM5_9HYPH|nr:lytic murein transglycosylase [Methylocystis bryophila]ARN82321.1 lytic transglycosylase [Methylocystis bryophila]BDV38472.1 lytic transglycosylase [Methylocystis bryophila]